MKILIATMPFLGHFNPLTGVAARLAERGHDVRWYAAPDYVGRVRRLGITAIPYRRAVAVTSENIAELYPQRAKLRGPRRLSFDFDRVFAACVLDNFLDIRDIRTDFVFDALICDAAFYAAYPVARSLRVPVYSVNPIPSLEPSRDVPPPFFGFKPARGGFGLLRDRAFAAMVRASSRCAVRTFNEALAVAGLAPVGRDEMFRISARSARRVFQSGVPGTDFPRSDFPPNINYVGAVLPHRSGVTAPLDERISAWQGRVVVVSQGTVDNRDPEKLIIPALDALAGGPHLAVAVTAGAHTERLRGLYPQSNVLVEDFIDFDKLFAHTDVLVCNGGHGSVMLALEHSVPMVVAGFREGKNDINARLDYNGLAVDLRTESPTPRRIAAAIEQVLRDDAMRGRVQEVGRELEGYDALDIIEKALVKDFALS